MPTRSWQRDLQDPGSELSLRVAREAAQLQEPAIFDPCPAHSPFSTRLERGYEIAGRPGVVQDGAAWLVPSQSGAGVYSVTLTAAGIVCTCPDFRRRLEPCKHIFAAAIVAKRARDEASAFHTTDGHYFASDGDRRAHQRTLDERAARDAARRSRFEGSRSVA